MFNTLLAPIPTYAPVVLISLRLEFRKYFRSDSSETDRKFLRNPNLNEITVVRSRRHKQSGHILLIRSSPDNKR